MLSEIEDSRCSAVHGFGVTQKKSDIRDQKRDCSSLSYGTAATATVLVPRSLKSLTPEVEYEKNMTICHSR